MSDLFGQLGINLPMLLAQAVNFGVLLAVLTIFVYRPLLKAMEERRKKIELGVKGGELAQEKLAQADRDAGVKIKEAGEQAIKLIGQAEKKAVSRGQEIVAAAGSKSEALLLEAKLSAERKKIEELEKLSREASTLIKEAIATAVEMEPALVDDRLIQNAVKVIRTKITT